MRAGHSSGRSDESDLLSPFDRITDCHKRFAEVEIRGDDTSAVVDVDDVAGKKEIVDERNDTAVCRTHRLANGATEINAEVAAGHAAVEETSGSKLARYYRRAWAKERSGPHPGRIMSTRADRSRPEVLSRYPCGGRRVEGASERAIYGEWLRHRWSRLGQRQPCANCFNLA
jgi:hypothetical protein